MNLALPIRAFHTHSGTLIIKTRKWFYLTIFAAQSDPGINDGIPCLEISIRIFRFYRVFHFDTY